MCLLSVSTNREKYGYPELELLQIQFSKLLNLNSAHKSLIILVLLKSLITNGQLTFYSNVQFLQSKFRSLQFYMDVTFSKLKLAERFSLDFQRISQDCFTFFWISKSIKYSHIYLGLNLRDSINYLDDFRKVYKICFCSSYTTVCSFVSKFMDLKILDQRLSFTMYLDLDIFYSA